MENQTLLEKPKLKPERKSEPRKTPLSVKADEMLIRMLEATNNGWLICRVRTGDA